MNRHLLIIVMAFLSLAVSARNKYSLTEDNYHFGYVSVGGGYTSLSCRSDVVSVKGSAGYQFGLGYEFRKHGFWVNAGLQFQSLASSITIDEYQYIPPVGGMDDLGNPVKEYIYTVNQQDRQDWKTIDIPIMAGYYNSGFYVGAGFKVGFPIYDAGIVSGSYDIDAVYERYVGVASDMHYYKTYPYEGKANRYTLRPMFSVLGEMGYDVLSSMGNNSLWCHMLKIGLYFEYGIRSIKTAPLVEPLTINPDNITEVAINPYFATQAGTKDWTVPYLVGLKITYVLGKSRSATSTWHKGCQCYY